MTSITLRLKRNRASAAASVMAAARASKGPAQPNGQRT